MKRSFRGILDGQTAIHYLRGMQGVSCRKLGLYTVIVFVTAPNHSLGIVRSLPQLLKHFIRFPSVSSTGDALSKGSLHSTDLNLSFLLKVNGISVLSTIFQSGRVLFSLVRLNFFSAEGSNNTIFYYFAVFYRLLNRKSP